MSNNWIIVGEPGEAATLAELFGCPASELNALVVGPRALADDAARCVGNVAWIETGNVPADDYAEAAAAYLLSAGADMVMGTAAPAARSAMGIVGERLGAGVVSNVIKATPGEPKLVERLTIDDRVIETVEIAAPAVLLVNPLAVEKDARSACAQPAAIEQVPARPAGRVRRTGLESAEASGLEGATRIVGVGRGVKDRDAFKAVAQLAAAMDAEIGCTMPIYTDYDYLPKDSHYIGLSGLSVTPKLYLALGVSGTSQHLAGIRNADTVVCVNKDPKAKFFCNADYGIVGTVEEMVPALTNALS
ncbi:electron transfer flavoprotein subunit alpha/FixB family protein [Eggerthella guodeyinii]|uniref:Electron transfer flavoprotein subunit alpha/FixB family protein n=1 Tax=Eggerthella guodeyinii TaxID=2690837 RepID=A0A6N7RIP6_9ACTN|nr:FAD-binding protein [Eggerthella guodeyinii]MRX81106.1 hypothetical protein [Eggerthella guodeyinii]